MDHRAAFSLFRVRPYRLFFTARTTSASSDAMLPVAMVVAALAAGYGTGGLGLVLGADVAMFVVFVLVGGVLADRFGPRRLMIGADVARFAVQGALAVTLLITTHPPFWWFLLGSSVHGVAAGLFQPGLGSVLPAITPGRVQEAAGLVTSAVSLATVVCMAGAGGIVAAGGPQTVFAIDSATYAVSAVCLLRLKLPPVERAGERQHWLADMAEGWREFKKLTWFWTVIVVFAFLSLAAFGPFWVLSTSYLTRHHGSSVFGLILAAESLGSVLGGLTVVRFRPRFPLRAAFTACMVMTAPALTLGFGAPVLASGVAMFVAGWGRSVELVLWTTTGQTLIPAPILNRLYAYDVAGCTSLLALGEAIAGPEASLIGERPALLACAGILVVGCVTLLLVPAVRNLAAANQDILLDGADRGESAGVVGVG